MLSDLIRSLSDAPTRHAILVHVPIALGALGVLPLLACAIGRFRSRVLAMVCVGVFVLASGGAALAEGAGEDAAEHAGPLGAPAKQALERHEDLGEGGWVWPLIPASLSALTLVRRRSIAVPAGAVALVAAVGVGAWVSLAGHTGGVLVYTHGINAGPRSTPVAVPGHAANGDD